MKRVHYTFVLLFLAACGDDDRSPPLSEDSAAADAIVEEDAGKKPRDAALDATKGDAGRDARVGLDGGDGSVDARTDSPVATKDAGDAAEGSDSGPVEAGVDSEAKPPKWSCRESFLNDGVVCDCGCTAPDPDCRGAGCSEPGCSTSSCDVCFNLNGAAITCTVAPAWACGASEQNDGICDCGCGAPDPDCAGEGCTTSGCATERCERCHGAAGAEMACEVDSWICSQSVYGSGDGCDCGCGAPDPDCAGEGCMDRGCDAPTCLRCHDVYGRVAPCAQWTCAPLAYADGNYCDCGCNRLDPDCGDKGCIGYPCADGSACDYCYESDGSPRPCTAWSCSDISFDNEVCDCGCGALDPDCGRADPGCLDLGCTPTAACEMCVKGGQLVSCQWQCEPAKYDDGTSNGCDCGCGAVDPDCGAEHTCAEPNCWGSGCDSCYDSDGNTFDCQTTNCDSAIIGKGDGVCDCGCGGLDPDCADSDKQGCAPAGCGLKSCDRCYDSDGKEIGCWVCDPSSQNDDKCDCGCGVSDRACPSGQGCTSPGCSVIGCQVCHDLNGDIRPCGGG
jgi:hypothetical protein